MYNRKWYVSVYFSVMQFKKGKKSTIYDISEKNTHICLMNMQKITKSMQADAKNGSEKQKSHSVSPAENMFKTKKEIKTLPKKLK